MKFLFGLVLGIIIGAAGVWYYVEHHSPAELQSTGQQVHAAAKSAQDTVQDKLKSLHLSGADITNELARTGRVIRQKAQQAGQALSDATADARITASIKTKLVRDPDLSAWDISVNTTGGVVTLSGQVSTADKVGKAMLLAMETDGVRQVISTLQVKPK